MNEEKIIKNAYGKIDLPDTDMYIAVITRLAEPKRRYIFLKPTIITIIVLTTVFSVTAIAAPMITERYFPPFYTEEGEYIEPMKEYEYAQSIEAARGDDPPYFTREQLVQFWDSGIPEHDAIIRQPHIQPIPAFTEGGSNAPLDLCNNTIYLLYDGMRACYSCGFIFTEEQNREIGLLD